MTDSQNLLTRNTLIPLGLVAALLCGFGGGAWSFHSWAVDDALWKQNISRDIESLRNAEATKAREAWGRSDMREWTSLLREANPDIVVPPVRPVER